VFERSFGAPVTDLASLIATKTVTIPQLMEIVPSGVVDPSPTLYNTTLYAMAGLAAVRDGASAAAQALPEAQFRETLGYAAYDRQAASFITKS
jgi:hypothetical protein